MPCDSSRDVSPSRMRNLLTSFSGLVAIVLCAGCTETVSHQIAFDEAAFKGSERTGNATVTGRAYGIYRGNEHIAGDETVQLLPVNAYTTETVQGLLSGRQMQPDPRLTKYSRSASSDSNGNFVIHHVPAGEYYVISFAEWHHQYEAENGDDTGTDKVTADYKKPIFAKASVRAGETVRVNQWNQECPDIGLPFAHG